MGFFDRWLGRRQSLDALTRPWGDRPSIHDFLRRVAGPDGSLPPECELPDTAEPDGELRWAPGALDGVMSHHAGPADDARRAAAIAASVAAMTRRPTDEELAHLCSLATEAPILQCVDELASAVMAMRDLDADRLHELARYLATRSADREVVKLGLALLGVVAGPDDRELLWTLGAHDELTLFAIVALMNRPDASERDLWELAKRPSGWGRIQAVERLADTNDPAIQRWMLREGFRNAIMDEYLAHVCATTGRLHEALAEGDVDAALLAGAAGLLAALVGGGPAKDMSDYPQGAVASERFLELVRTRTPAELELLPAVLAIRRFVDGDHDWEALARFGWTDERRGRLRTIAESILARPDWESRVEAALDAPDQEERWRAEHLARLLGIDTWERLRARLERDPLSPSDWLELMRQCDGERIEVALALAERLPLDAIATGPAEELGLGPGFEPHSCLDAVLQDLDRYPGRGWALLEAGLASPVVRNRNMALRSLAAWPREAWPAEARPALERLREREPSDEVRERVEAVLAGRALD